MSSSRFSSKAYQRDLRTSLFTTQDAQAQPQQFAEERPASPYGNPSAKDYNASMLSHLESQNEDEYSSMSDKLVMLKDLGNRMGDEIRKSNLDISNLNSNLDTARLRLKSTFGRMMTMAKSSGIGWRNWLVFFAVVCFLFFLVWVF
ncbi:unnamed protein product [Kuraishia capsulata CBS 1993]|uniref:t-SNARE coiled-coil homology domain-containing protein n=1 Tax=Kuraishia capsulata CBS 1993 TaxID=1382522 RepID=W6MLW0_9ASCO|nr:uncharacterized protein KUCA_T00001843001 [Kuraishia capsulata CBS 1993]CDK25872.1 unnamed protein product [Kuraishia capsulata CBS 1993]